MGVELVVRVGLVCLEARREFVGVPKDLFDGAGHGHHLRELLAGSHRVHDDIGLVAVDVSDFQGDDRGHPTPIQENLSTQGVNVLLSLSQVVPVVCADSDQGAPGHAPVLLGDAFLGVVGADLPLSGPEASAFPMLAPAGEWAVANAEGRIVLATSSRWLAGARLPRESPRQPWRSRTAAGASCNCGE